MAKSQPKLLWAFVTSSFPWALALVTFLDIWIGLVWTDADADADADAGKRRCRGSTAEGQPRLHVKAVGTRRRQQQQQQQPPPPPADAARKSRRKDTDLALKVLC
uniref:Uncharacterized protein n=1 Tax=Oryza glaberrima TaxID=4538 RepID=I1PV83_ORYGL